MLPSSLLDSLAAAAHSDRGITVLADQGPLRITYSDLAGSAARVAGGLADVQDRGLPILVIYPTGPEFIDAFWGAMWAGMVPAPLSMPRPFSDLEAYAARVAACSRRAGDAPILTSPMIASLLRGTRAGRELRCVDVAALRAGPALVPHVTTTAMLQFTSGSLADPKGTMLSHAALLADVNGMATRIDGRRPDDVVAGWVPLVHDMGLIGGMIYPLVSAIDAVLIPTERFLMDPQLWLRAMSDHRATITGAPPFGYGMVTRRAEPSRYDLSALRSAIVGAEPIDARVLRKFITTFAPSGLRPTVFRPCYGMAETCVVATSTPVETALTTLTVAPQLTPGDTVQLATGPTAVELVGCGSAIPGLEVIVADDDGHPLPEGTIGEIRVRGAARFDGYWNDVEATASALTGEWLLTGDFGFVHAGALYIAGRRKDVIIQRGRKLFPEELEAIAYELPGVRARGALAFGQMDPAGGPERIHLVLETSLPEAERPPLAELARQTIADRMDCVIDVVTFCAPRELPRTPSGKIRRGEGRTRWGGVS